MALSFRFARIVKNVGGRLLLRWELKENSFSSQSAKPSDFWLYFCHARVHYLGYAEIVGNIMYEPVVPYDGWVSDISTFLQSKLDENAEEETGLHKLRRAMLTAAQSKKVDLLKPESLKMVHEGDQVLMFPSNLLKLLPATIESKLSEQSFRIKANGPNGEISFCYPYEDNHSILPFAWSDDNEIPIDFGSDHTHEANWSAYLKATGARAAPIAIKRSDKIDHFKINSKLEVVHPDSPDTICDAIIIRVTKPLIWVQLSAESIYVLPFNSTDLFPSGWCSNHNWPLSRQLPRADNTAKKAESEAAAATPSEATGDLAAGSSTFLPAQPKAWCPRIFFNHKCFTGPALSKSKICELPRFVGPGPVLLVIQEVLSKIISVAYVPSRVLNELSGKLFNDILRKEKLKTEPLEFKAKYQKRTSRDTINVVRTADDVEHYCRLVCSHLKCCFNLFGPNLYDGDTCPSNCRGLTKSNKVLKRAAYYREKAIEEKKAEEKDAAGDAKDEKSETSSDKADKADKSSKKSTPSVSDQEAPPPKKEEVKKKRRRGRVPNALRQLGITSLPAEFGKKRRHVNDDQESNLSNDRTSQASVKENKVRRVDETSAEPLAEKSAAKNKSNSANTEATNTFDNPFDWSIDDVFRFLMKSNCAAFASTLKNHVSILQNSACSLNELTN